MSVLWSNMSGIQMVCLIMWSDHLKTGQKSVRKVQSSGHIELFIESIIKFLSRNSFLKYSLPIWGNARWCLTNSRLPDVLTLLCLYSSPTYYQFSLFSIGVAKSWNSVAGQKPLKDNPDPKYRRPHTSEKEASRDKGTKFHTLLVKLEISSPASEASREVENL